MTEEVRTMNALDVEIESGTYSGHERQHNGYYAGDFHTSCTSVRQLHGSAEVDTDSQRRDRGAVAASGRHAVRLAA
jgi:hypothetical protein